MVLCGLLCCAMMCRVVQDNELGALCEVSAALWSAVHAVLCRAQQPPKS